MTAASSNALVLGIDGGNSKVDVAVADSRGRLLAAARGPSVSHQAVALDVGMDRLRTLVEQVLAAAHRDAADVAVLVAALAGADYPRDVRLLRREIGRLSLAREVVVVNDTLGALRAGTLSGWGVALICGQGINAAAMAPDGRVAGFPAVGDIAGDWGGGGVVGLAGLQAAVRGRDGRGPRTSLERAVPRFFGLSRPSAVTHALYVGSIEEARINDLSAVVFAEAEAGDAVAQEIVERLATELATMARALIRRLALAREEVEIVLAGGVFRTRYGRFYDSLTRQIHIVAPAALLVHLGCPPVAGAVLLAVDRLDQAGSGRADRMIAQRLRADLIAWDEKLASHPTTPG